MTPKSAMPWTPVFSSLGTFCNVVLRYGLTYTCWDAAEAEHKGTLGNCPEPSGSRRELTTLFSPEKLKIFRQITKDFIKASACRRTCRFPWYCMPLQEEGLTVLQDRFTNPGENKYRTEIFGNPIPFLFWVAPWLLVTLRTNHYLLLFLVYSLLCPEPKGNIKALALALASKNSSRANMCKALKWYLWNSSS